MKMNFIPLILLSASFCFSCQKDDDFITIENDSIIYVSFEPNIVVLKDQPYELEITGDKDSDLYFTFDRWEESKNDILYTNYYSKISPTQDYITISWGSHIRTNTYYIEYGNAINSGFFVFDELPDGMRIAGSNFGLSVGVWNINNRQDGYIGIRMEKNDNTRYGWLHIAVSDTSLILKEYALEKISGTNIMAGIKPL